ncbi:MAG: hypothetical protein M1133_15655 [Armatimonadetes bacterium]|nr:hypothetical protein [Armatimonadota bacterium]
MSITITTAEVKRKAMIDSGDTTYDSSISSLVSEMQPALEYSITDAYYNDTSNTKLQATLKLGMLEMIAGEFVEQLRRESGRTEQFSVAGVSIGELTQRGVDLVQQGATRLAPYLKAALPMMSEAAAASSTADKDMVFSDDEEVW